MDICKLLKCINNLDEYISVTQDIMHKYSNCNILFNMSTVLAMKNIRFFEIEYFNKCDENGAVFIVFERILRLPPSKTWSLLGVELISLVQYWLEALRKHLIFHNNHWWIFLNTLLSFIEKIRLKSASIKNILVQETAECLLDLATNDKPDLPQRYKILHCFNLCSADSSREIRTSLREKFGSYFSRLATLMSSCGDMATQYSALEALLRWLLPRQDPSARARAAADWFPPPLYSRRCVDVFLERRWHHFFQDARAFLNAHNEASGLVASAPCRGFAIGGVVLVSEGDAQQHWVDVNTRGRSVSLMLDPRLLALLQAADCDALSVHKANVENIYLQRVGPSLHISATILDPRQLFPSSALDGAELAIVLADADLDKIDAALRTAFEDKYTVLTSVDSSDNRENQAHSVTQEHVASTRADAKKKHSGFIVNRRVPVSLQSPSTASTSSLAMLRDKLTGLSGFIYDKEPVSVCAVPQLSNVTEVSEPDEKRSFNSLSTLKLRSYGIQCRSNISAESNKVTSDSSHEASLKRKCISPVLEGEESNVSCLIVATIGSADDSIINDTLSRLPKEKDIHTDNIVELLAKEALQYRQATADAKSINEIKTDFSNYIEQRPIDSNINKDKKSYLPIKATGNEIQTDFSKCLKQTSSDRNINNDNQLYLSKKQTVISNTTTDDSNLDVVENTPVTTTKKSKKLPTQKFTDKSTKENLNVDNDVIENFFTQHINENSDKEILISPTLAKKINNSSSESSVELDVIPDIVENDFNINDIEIIECLNEMVDNVCKDLEKCSKYVSRNVNVLGQLNDEGRSSKRQTFKSVTNVKDVSEKLNEDRIEPQSTKGIKLKFNTKNSRVAKRRIRNKKKNELEPILEIARTLESTKLITSENITANENPVMQSLEPATFKTPNTRRKRKLYSPKDDISNEQEADMSDMENNQDVLVKSKRNVIKNNKTLVTPYKDIENMRKEANTNVRKRIRNKELLLSPRSKKQNDIFDNLKNTIEGEKNIVLVERNTRNKHAIYNFPSDSEEDDFKEKEVVIKSRKKKVNNTTTNKSVGRRKLNRSKNEEVEQQKVNNKPNTRSRKKAVIIDYLDRPQLSFERMRGPPPECLELSFVAQGHTEICDNELEHIVAVVPEMELENTTESTGKPQKKQKKRRINKEMDIVKSIENINELIIMGDKSGEDVTVSPLPNLVIEAVPLDDNKKDSISICMLEDLNDLTGDNNTQSLLSDTNQVECPPHYVSDQISVATSRESKKRKSKHNLSTRKRVKNEKIEKVINTKIHKSPKQEIINLESGSDKSIITAGKSPITAHGDFDEAPPSFRQLSQRIVEPRGLDVSNLSGNMEDYFKILNNEVNRSHNTSCSTSTDQEQKRSNVKENKKVINLSPVVSVARLSLEDIGKWIPPRFNSVFGSDQSSNDSVARDKLPSVEATSTKSKKKSIDADKEVTKNNLRKSLISPIKLFDDIVDREENRHSHNSDKENLVFNNNLVRKNSGLTNYDLKSDPRWHNSTSSHAKERALTPKRGINRVEKYFQVDSDPRQIVEYESPKKKQVSSKVQRNYDIESAPSTSTVNEWMSKNAVEKNTAGIYASKETDSIPENDSATSEDSRTQRKRSHEKKLDDSIDLSLKDNIDTVLEKLDTTLTEIHHNTSKKLVNMFLGIQKGLNDVKEQRRQMYKGGVRELLSEMIKHIDTKFADLDRRSQQMDDQLMSDLKEQTREVLRNDCKQKRAMVTLLREDIQAVRDHVARTNRS